MALFALMAAAIAVAAPVSTPPTVPSALALEATLLIRPEAFGPITLAPAGQIANGFTNSLLSTISSSGSPCDRTDGRCSAAAATIAARNASLYLDAVRATIAEMFAAELDRSMQPADLAATINFLKSPSGAAFAVALRRTANPFGDRQRAYALLADVQQRLDKRWSKTAMLDEFHSATRSLPRGRLMAPPPPAPSPTPPISPRQN